jgi:hypothetical protein
MSDRFKRMRDISLSDSENWNRSLYITLDIDWACDEVISHAIDILERADVCATWFVTHQTPMLERLRENPKFELGIHPNFNFLLNGSSQAGANASEVINNILKIVPESVSARSHSMTQSTNIMGILAKAGQIYDCNHFVPHQSGISLKPWQTWNGLTKVPYFWEDDIACIYQEDVDMAALANTNGLKVFDFHPIHLYLNTEAIERYESSRAHHNDVAQLNSYVNDGVGARNYLLALLEAGDYQ